MYYDVAIATGAGDFYNFEMKMCHTSLTELTNNFADNYDGNTPVVVRPVGMVSFPDQGDYWYGIPGFTSFDYNGTDNLIIELHFNGTSGASYHTWYGEETNRNLLGTSYNATTGSLGTILLRTKIWITYGIIESASLGKVKAVFK